jgi:hypothetical protein
MKTLAIIFSIVGIVALNSCSQKTETKAMLQDSETRTEIFTAITESHDYMTEFMENMQNSQHAMQMMEGNQKMTGQMIKGNGMQMMMKDSMMMKSFMGNQAMMQNMMGQMMNNGEIMANMMKMMNEKGMMSEACMQSGMKMMSDKGMEIKGMAEMKN